MTRTPLAFQAVPPASESQASAQQAPVAQGASEGAPAAAPGFLEGPGFLALMFIPLILLLFWQSRSQQKKQEKAINELKKGDRVVTQSGLIGRLVEIDNRYAKLDLAPSVRIQVLRSSLTGRDTQDAAADSKDSAKDKGGKDSSKDDK